jgi:hypothetical protein
MAARPNVASDATIDKEALDAAQAAEKQAEEVITVATQV